VKSVAKVSKEQPRSQGSLLPVPTGRQVGEIGTTGVLFNTPERSISAKRGGGGGGEGPMAGAPRSEGGCWVWASPPPQKWA